MVGDQSDPSDLSDPSEIEIEIGIVIDPCSVRRLALSAP
jgi:hypothetical protein